jgi:hypothetical protein
MELCRTIRLTTAVPRRELDPDTLFDPELAKLGLAIRWLRDHGLSCATLASLFSTTAGRISVLVHRAQPGAQRATPVPQFGTARLDDIFSREPTFEELEPVRERPEALDPDLIAENIAGIASTNAAQYRFLRGIRELRKLRPHLGRPRAVHRMRLHAQLHRQVAWFFTHSGWSRSSIAEANTAFELAADLYRRTHSQDDLTLLADAALIASNAYLICYDSVRARHCLHLARQATETCKERPGSEYYRQLATATLQENDDGAARKYFKIAGQVMGERGCADAAEVLMASTRQESLLTPVDWDAAQEMCAAVRQRFSLGSIELAIGVNWTAACGFSTDSPSVNLQAQALIEGNCEHASHFGHQATVATLLRYVPALPQSLRRDFVRFALYQNAYRDR